MTIMPFQYGEQPVRVVDLDGEPWFVLAARPQEVAA